MNITASADVCPSTARMMLRTVEASLRFNGDSTKAHAHAFKHTCHASQDGSGRKSVVFASARQRPAQLVSTGMELLVPVSATQRLAMSTPTGTKTGASADQFPTSALRVNTTTTGATSAFAYPSSPHQKAKSSGTRFIALGLTSLRNASVDSSGTTNTHSASAKNCHAQLVSTLTTASRFAPADALRAYVQRTTPGMTCTASASLPMENAMTRDSSWTLPQETVFAPKR